MAGRFWMRQRCGNGHDVLLEWNELEVGVAPIPPTYEAERTSDGACVAARHCPDCGDRVAVALQAVPKSQVS